MSAHSESDEFAAVSSGRAQQRDHAATACARLCVRDGPSCAAPTVTTLMLGLPRSGLPTVLDDFEVHRHDMPFLASAT